VAGGLHDQVIDQTYWLVHFRAGSLSADPLDRTRTMSLRPMTRRHPGGIRLTAPVLAALLLTRLPVLALGQSTAFPLQFTAGERLTFSGRWGFLPLGEATMSVLPDDFVRGVETRHFQLAIRANLSGVYRLNDRFESWVANTDGLSRRYVQDYDESNQHRRNEYVILPDSGYYRRSGIDSTFRTVPEPLDETAFLYWVRTLKFEPGDTLVFNRYFRPERNPVTITVLRRDTIDVPAGRFETVLIHPVIPDGGVLFSEAAESLLWITDDGRRLVVQIRAKLAGYVTVSLRLCEFELPAAAPR
jgi:hypothetical protein